MNTVETRIGRLRRRLISVHLAAGTVWALAAALLLLLAGAWLDLLWELPPAWRVATLWLAVVSAAALLAVLILAAWRAARGFALARRLDRAGNAGGRILTGWEFEQNRYGIAGQQPPPLSAGLAALAVEDAARRAGQIQLGRAVPWRPLRRALAAIALLVAILATAAVVLPGMAKVQWNRFVRPYADVPPFSLTEFDVTPGDKADVIYGSDVEICATVRGTPVDQVEIVLTSARGREPPLPMFPESDGRWRTVLTKVVEPTDYYVRAYRARSRTYHLGLITVPRIESAKVRIVQPAYGRRPPYDGPLPKDGVSGLRGTKVEVVLTSNRPLSGGQIALTMARVPAQKSELLTKKPRNGAAILPMKPYERGGQEVSGEFTIAGDGKFECRVVDEAGQTSQESFSGSVLLLPDERPVVRLMQPPRISLATPSAALPVVLSAEDDCGISRLQLFRSLNDSRPLPVDLPLPAPPPRRLDVATLLPFGLYQLTPGDVVKIFGRVEDNDPDGAKGTESAVAVVRIISDEDFRKLMQAQEGLESLLSKYDDARRRMEQLTEEVEGLRKKAKKQKDNDKTSEELRRELTHLQQKLRQEAEEIRKAAKRELPFDVDKALTPELQRLAKSMSGLADQLEQLQRERDLVNSKLRGKLDEMAQRMKAARQLYHEMAEEPLAYLEAAFPLLADQDRFVMLVLWQRDLADRLSALKGHDKEDNPALKARMRDLQEEQQQVHDALARLLDDIDEHLAKLPDKPEFKELRQTAEEFAKQLRKCGASEAMAAAESALSEFNGTRGYQKAKEAADILGKFLNQCKCKGGAGRGMNLAFQPSLCRSMGNTLDQLLAGLNMGAGSGSGAGMGFGGEGNVGLFGGMPNAAGAEKMSEGGRSARLHRRGYSASPSANPDQADSGLPIVPGQAGGASEGAVPNRYRRQVGQYFQRIAEETGGQDQPRRQRRD
ncbi:MAG: hypothetical protein LLG00_10840 [Planctomycetaceae bacterium]|nr:hypothetical protein [Planctomycetaceae bacterium]